jgi:hypothetical protein
MAQMGLKGLIFTFVYTPPSSDEFIGQVLEVCEQSGIEVLWVKLEAPPEVLLQRVALPERKSLKKLSRPERLLQMLEQGALQGIPFGQSLRVDTSQLLPEQAARVIVQHFGLQAPS